MLLMRLNLDLGVVDIVVVVLVLNMSWCATVHQLILSQKDGTYHIGWLSKC